MCHPRGGVAGHEEADGVPGWGVGVVADVGDDVDYAALVELGGVVGDGEVDEYEGGEDGFAQGGGGGDGEEGGGGEDVENGEEGVEEAHFFVRDEGVGYCCEEGDEGELELGSGEGGVGDGVKVFDGGVDAGFEEGGGGFKDVADFVDREGEVGGEEEGEALRDVVVPGHGAVKDRELLDNVEDEEFEWWEGKLSIVPAVQSKIRSNCNEPNSKDSGHDGTPGIWTRSRK